jgi:hypothetical protein
MLSPTYSQFKSAYEYHRAWYDERSEITKKNKSSILKGKLNATKPNAFWLEFSMLNRWIVSIFRGPSITISDLVNTWIRYRH